MYKTFSLIYRIFNSTFQQFPCSIFILSFRSAFRGLGDLFAFERQKILLRSVSFSKEEKQNGPGRGTKIPILQG